MRARRPALILLLAGPALTLGGCGSAQLLGPDVANELQSSLKAAQSAYRDGDCDQADRAVAQGLDQVKSLPSTVDSGLVDRLQSGFERLDRTIGQNCKQPAPAETQPAPAETQPAPAPEPTTTTAPEPTTTTAPEPTTTTPPDKGGSGGTGGTGGSGGSGDSSGGTPAPGAGASGADLRALAKRGHGSRHDRGRHGVHGPRGQGDR